MSGGIDSSVAAMLLHQEGYEVIGVTMKTWDYAQSGGGKKTTGCCSLDDINDARAMAVELGFPHYILDIRSEFGEAIIENFVEEYFCKLVIDYFHYNNLKVFVIKNHQIIIIIMKIYYNC